MSSSENHIKPGALIAVTGANGYVGSHIVRLLLSKGYRVRAVVREPNNEQKVGHLKKFEGARDRLELVQGDLEESAYLKAFAGVDAVIHLATPYRYKADDPDKEIVQPAVAGTVSAMSAALKNKVKRIIVCSSGGAFLSIPVAPGKHHTTSDVLLLPRKAEEAAWTFYKEHPELELVVVNPLYILGPTITPNLNESMTNIKKLLMGEPGALLPPGTIGVVDVRDVATAHLLALEKAAPGQRLFNVNKTVVWALLPATLKRLFPEYPNTPHAEVTPATFTIDNEPLKKLGLTQLHDFDETMKDTVEALIAVGAVPDLRKNK